MLQGEDYWLQMDPGISITDMWKAECILFVKFITILLSSVDIDHYFILKCLTLSS